MNVYVLGITGGVGCGKSTVLQYLKEAYGAVLIECDEVARELQQPGRACYEPIIRLFGDGIVQPDGTLDRKAIAEIVFKDAELLRKLNAIVHPAVKEQVRETIRQYEEAGSVDERSDRPGADRSVDERSGQPGADRSIDNQSDRPEADRYLIVIEAALLLDDGYDAVCDEIFYVYAPEDVRRQRLKDSRRYTDERITETFQSQRKDESFRALCDAVIDNSSSDPADMFREVDVLLIERGFTPTV